jgi:hypothetical protein
VLSADNPAWLTPAAIRLACCIAWSHSQAFGRPLLASPATRAARPAAGIAAQASDQGNDQGGDQGSEQGSEQRLLAQELFATDTVVLAHDGAPLDAGEGPRLIYANRAALRLWRRNWGSMVGMPSSRTAEPSARTERQQALAAALQQLAISNYSGIRIDSAGRRFAINSARIWTLIDTSGQPCGQAAAFSDWHWL